MQAAMEPMPEPREKEEAIQIASFGFTLVTPKDEIFTDDIIDKIKEEIIKPLFVKASMKIKLEFNDNIEIKINSVERGSIVIDASLFATVLVASGATSVATGLLTNIITRNMYTDTEKNQYEVLMNKITVICRTYALESKNYFNERMKHSVFITMPDSHETEVKDFYFKPEKYEDAKKAVNQAVKNYHDCINKP